MDISIIIATWNNSKRLVVTLEAMARCRVPQGVSWELIVVNNNSTDGTDTVVKDFVSRMPLVYIKESRQGLSRARNAGLSAASGDLVIFSDDDVRPYEEWISTYWSAYQEKPDGFYFGGPVESEYEVDDVDCDLLKLAPPSVRGLDWGRDARTLAEYEYFIGANWACSSKALKLSGGFDLDKGLNPLLGRVNIGEEKYLMLRLRKNGFSPWYLPQAKIRHFVPKHKCTLKHISDRIEASGYEGARKDAKGPFINSIPRWMYKKVFILWLQWVGSKMRGDRSYGECCNLKHFIGEMKGVRDKKNKELGIGIVLFWYMNDWGKYGRAYEKIAEGLSKLPIVKKVLCVFPPEWMKEGARVRPFSLTKLSKTLLLLTLNAQIVPSVLGGNRLKQKIKGVILHFVLSDLMKSMGFTDQNTVLWMFPPHPFISQLLSLVPHRLSITQVVDNNSVKKNESEEKILFAKQQYEELAKSSDIVITSSQMNFQLFHSLNPSCYLFENGLDPIFINNPSKPPRLINNARPRLGYVGFISERTDIKLLDHIARTRPEYDLVIAGPQEEDLNKYGTLGLPNVTYAGVVPYKDVPGFLAKIDVCLIPHKDTDFCRSMSPLKLLQYLGSGRPVVSTPVINTARWEGLVSFAYDHEDFIRKIDGVLKDDHEDLSAKRIAAAKSETWEKRVADISKVITQHLQEKGVL